MMAAQRSHSASAGWLPIDIALDPQPDLVPPARVRWMYFGSTPLAEPFMGYTVEKLRKRAPPARELETDFATLLRVAPPLPFGPHGLIFHVSHCGSTLIANCLKAANTIQVAAEHTPITKLLSAFPRCSSRFAAERWSTRTASGISAICSQLATYRAGSPEPLVVKFSSRNILFMTLVRSIWPDTPCLLVVRDPVEIIVATLRARSGQGRISTTADDRAPILDCAQTLGDYFSAALQHIDGSLMIIDHATIDERRMDAVARFFGIGMLDRDRLTAAINVYSKDPTQSVRFKDDRAQKQASATEVIRDIAEQFAMPGYRSLVARATS